MDLSRFNTIAQRDILDASQALALCPLSVHDCIRIGRSEWVVWFHFDPMPKIGHIEDGHELSDLDSEDKADVERLLWWRAFSGCRPPEGQATMEVEGCDVDLMLSADVLTGRYTLTFSVFGQLSTVVPPGHPDEIETLISEALYSGALRGMDIDMQTWLDDLSRDEDE